MILRVKPPEREIREALARVLSSRTFGGPRSAVHHLLAWLGERSLRDPEAPLKEYTIGVEAFGRPEHYDPQQDAYVRVQAGRLRQKLLEYYATEGAADPVRIELPRRRFLLEFHEQSAPPAGEPAAPDARPNRSRWTPLAVLLLVWALAATALAVWPSRGGEAAPSPDLASVWRTFLSSSRPVLVSLGTHQFYLYRGGFLREPSLDRAAPEQLAQRLETLARVLDSGPLLPNQGYTGTGQATGAFLLGRFFGRAGHPVQLVRSSALTWDDISGQNVIFLGSAKSNPQILSLPADWAFSIDGERIVNRSPKDGEPRWWASGPWGANRERDEFALISFVPGLHRAGEILVIEAATTTAIWAGAKYLTEPAYARELVSRLASPGGKLPDHHQIVLRVKIRDAVPLKLAYETHRVL